MFSEKPFIFAKSNTSMVHDGLPKTVRLVRHAFHRRIVLDGSKLWRCGTKWKPWEQITDKQRQEIDYAMPYFTRIV